MKSRLMIAVIAVSLALVAGTRAGELPPADGSANAQFRRTVDPSPRAASGKVAFRVSNSGGKQTCTIQIADLTLTDFGVFIGNTPTPDTNALISGVAPLNRTNLKKGTWSRIMTGVNGAPLEFDVPNLNDLAGGTLFIAGAEDNALESGVTNITGCVTNIVGTTTNINNCVTNTYFGIPLDVGATGTVSTILWAPIPPVIAKPAELNYRNTLDMALPPAPAPSPNAKGKVSVKFNNSQGQSILDIQGTSLTAGQTYTVFIGDTTNNPPVVLVDAGTMTANKNGSDQRYLRDTKFGDPLPLQVRDIVDLTGHVVQIRDAFGEVHLRGVIP